MKNLINFGILFTLFPVIYADVVVTPCDGIPNVLHFVANGCDTLPCPLVRGTIANVNMTMRVPHEMQTSEFEIRARALGFWVNFPPPNNNTCVGLTNSYCPLEEGEVITYNLRLPVAKAYPKLDLLLQFKFFDEDKQAFMCFQVPCKVIDAPTKLIN